MGAWVRGCVAVVRPSPFATCSVTQMGRGVAGEHPNPFVYLFKDGLIEEKC
jgi:hypothetical protein